MISIKLKIAAIVILIIGLSVVVALLFPKFTIISYLVIGIINITINLVLFSRQLKNSDDYSSKFYKLMSYLKASNRPYSILERMKIYLNFIFYFFQTIILWIPINLRMAGVSKKAIQLFDFYMESGSIEFTGEILYSYRQIASLKPRLYLDILFYLLTLFYAFYLNNIGLAEWSNILLVCIVVSIMIHLLLVPIKNSFIEAYRNTDKNIIFNVLFFSLGLLFSLICANLLFEYGVYFSIGDFFDKGKQILTLRNIRSAYYSDQDFILYLYNLNLAKRVEILSGLIVYISIITKILDFGVYSRDIKNHEKVLDALNLSGNFSKAIDWQKRLKNTRSEFSRIQEAISLVASNQLERAFKIIKDVQLEKNSLVPKYVPSDMLLLGYIQIYPIPKYCYENIYEQLHQEDLRINLFKSLHVSSYFLDNGVLKIDYCIEIIKKSPKSIFYNCTLRFLSVTSNDSFPVKVSQNNKSKVDIIVTLIELIKLVKSVSFFEDNNLHKKLTPKLKKFNAEFDVLANDYEKYVMIKLYITYIQSKLIDSEMKHEVLSYGNYLMNEFSEEYGLRKSVGSRNVFCHVYPYKDK